MYKIKMRRGPEASLSNVIGNDYEVVFTIDTHKIFAWLEGEWVPLHLDSEKSKKLFDNYFVTFARPDRKK